MNFPSKRPLRSTHQLNGFALIATLSIMLLIVLLLVAMLSLSTTATRSQSNGKAQSEAQANAKLALMLAIGDLQKQLGPDQRITANGSIVSEAGGVLHPHWTGVWNSWKAGAGENSQHSTIGTGDEMAPTYGVNRSDHFRSWLLSLNQNDLNPNQELNVTLPLSLALDGKLTPGRNDTAIQLVGAGSLGNDTDRSENFVNARLISIANPTDPAKITGRYGWWAGDESQKARIMADSYEVDSEPLGAADKIFRSQAPGSMGNTMLSGLEGMTDQTQLNYLPSRNTLDLISINPQPTEGTPKPSQLNFHHSTIFSHGVLADVREGGLKRDLSTLLERTVDPNERADEFMLYKFDVKDAWANDPAKYPTLPETPQECVPIQDLAAFYQLYDQSRKAGIQYTSTALPNSIQLSNPDYGTPADYTEKFQREYTTLYRNPAIVKIQFLLSITAEPITGADRAAAWSGYVVNRFVPLTDTHKLRFAVIPAVTMWNPYNVPIVMESGESRSRQLCVKAPPLRFDIRKIRADGTSLTSTLSTNGIVTGSDQRSEFIKLNLARTSPIVFQPGEVRVFSASTSSPYFLAQAQIYYDNQSMNSAKNKVDAAPGWNPNGILTLQHSTGGYQIAQEHINRPGGIQTMNKLYTPSMPGVTRERWSFTMNQNSTDAFEFTVRPEPTNTTWPSAEGLSPNGAAFCFYMAQRNFSAQGNGANKGYSFLNVRHTSLVSRFGGGESGSNRRNNINKLPLAFNEQILKQGASAINLGTAMEPVTANTIAAASGAGETVPFLQMAFMAGCETSELANGGIVSGRKFPSRPFLHSSPIQPTVIDKIDDTTPYNHGWNWWIDEMNSVLESMVQESQSGNGFYGGGYSAESGATRVVQQEIPVTPPISIAALSHARLGGFTLANEVPVAHGFTGEMMEGLDGNQTGTDDPSKSLGFQRVTATGQGGLFPHVLQSIGNSYANPNLAAGVAFNPAYKRLCDQDDGERDVVFADHSYLANKALWDDYFFSSITPQPSTVEIFGGSPRDAKQVATDFFFDGKPLPNRRMVPYTVDMNETLLDELFATKDTYTNGLADKIAAHMMVEGPFNINSTSVEAWKVFFSSLKGKPIAYLDGGKTLKEAATGDKVPVGMGTLPNGLPATTADTEDARDPAQWKGLRIITEDEIDALAQAMVREVKKRGPFLSLSEFVNRRLDPDNTDGTAIKGALQAALDYDGVDNAGPEVTINKNFRDPSRTLDSEVSGIDFAFDDAAKGPAAYGSSAYIDQADVLRHFAEQLTPRGDTFVIRTYGDSLDAAGNVVARAWCEAVVQRTPDYLDATDDNHLKSDELQSPANTRFGRSFQVVSFRWLDASEI